tara:strand:+ start:66 stop:449 length:384 start_codon:yes stop_codon:yes gene_type:complete
MTYSISEDKQSLFLISVLGGILILSIPLISNHFFHSDHILHIAIHQAGFVLATFLTIIALVSYRKTKIVRMLFAASAFGVLAFGQGAYMYLEKDVHAEQDMRSSGEVLDICILIMTVLFAVGVFYKR